MKKVLLKLHLWLGFPLGILISLLCITGAILVFQDEIREWTNPTRYFVQSYNPEQKPKSIPDLIFAVEQQLEDNSIVSVKVPSDPKRNYEMGLKQGNRARLYVNPYTGEIMSKSERGEPSFFFDVMRLHRWLLTDPSEGWGKPIVGYTTIGFIFILLSGIVLWMPKNLKQLKTRLSVKTNANRQRLLWDLHTNLGIYLVVGLLALAVTGPTWSFPWYRAGFNAVFGVETPKQEPHKKLPKDKQNEHKTEEAKPLYTAQWQSILERAQDYCPTYRHINIEDGEASVTDTFIFGNPRAADKLRFDPESGAITKVKLYADSDPSGKIRGWIYAVHTGSWGGIFSKILTFIIALLGGTLPWTGYYIWYKKRHSKKKKASNL